MSVLYYTETNQEVLVGDIVTDSHNVSWEVVRWQAPLKVASTRILWPYGRVWVQRNSAEGVREFFPSVFGMKFSKDWS